MRKRFLQFIKKHALFNKQDRLLLAVSGGIDSMVMWHLVDQLDNEYAVAHCNFQLRGAESDQDEAFVFEHANKAGIPFFKKAFDTKSFAGEYKVSTQMAARSLRYDWFEELCRLEGYHKILVAHHQDDGVETFLINLIRGTSAKGLVGIRPDYEKIIRPLMCFNREEIAGYAQEYQISWREDSSNYEQHYMRNFLRHEVIPRFKELNPNFLETMQVNMEKMAEFNQLMDREVARFVEQGLRIRNDGTIELNKRKLIDLNIGPLALHELIGTNGFNYSQCKSILAAINGHSGKTFSSETHMAVIDREDILIRLIPRNSEESVWIEEGDDFITEPIKYQLSMKSSDLLELDTSSGNAMMDLDKLDFPLEVRRWRRGDKFKPLGMKGRKLISDLLIDNKMSVLDKDAVYVLLSKDSVVWVVGLRLSEDFKVTQRTKKVLHFEQIG